MTGSPRRGFCIDGAIVPAERAVVHVLDRGFLYGDGAFETMRAYGGRVFALGEHVQRLARSAARLRIDPAWGVDRIEAEVARAVDAAGGGELAVRAIVTRGAGAAGPPTRVVVAEPLPSFPPQLWTEGLRAIRVPGPRALADAKLLAYAPSLVAQAEARARGADDAIFADGDRLLEGATSNLFVIRGAALVTPPARGDLLAGITRAHVLACADAVGLRAVEADVTTEALWTADEAFLSSSLREIAPLVELDGRAIGAGRPGAGTRALHEALRRHIEASLASVAP